MESNTWICKITINDVLSFDHASQFVELTVQLSRIELEDDVEDDIFWKFTISAVLVCKAIFIGATSTNINLMTPKI
jgi:hypothetical protein